MKLYFLILFSCLAFAVFISFSLLLKEPAVWPDEVVFASVAREIASGSNVFRSFGYPPVTFYLLAGWFKMFGFSISNQRFLSLAVTSIFLLALFFLARLVLRKNSCLTTKQADFFSIIAVSSLVLDFTFLKGAKIGRPEIFLLLFGTLLLLFLLKSFESGVAKKWQRAATLLSGVLGGIAVLTHPIAAIFLIAGSIILFLNLRAKTIISWRSYLFIIPPLFLVLLVKLIHLFDMQAVAAPRLAVVQAQQSWLTPLFQTQPLELKIAYLGYFAITFVFFIFSLLKRQRVYLSLSLILFFCWAAAVYGKMFWYYLLPLPFVYLAGVIILSEAFVHKVGFKYPVFILAALVSLNLSLNLKTWTQMGGDNFSYQKFGESVQNIIPTGQTVFLSTIPDLYYKLKSSQPQAKVYEFPSSSIPRQEYLKELNDSDYIVYNGSYDSTFFGDLLVQYIEKNKESIFNVSTPNQYQALVIKLKPKEARQAP